MLSYVCIKCGRAISTKETKGSMMHPYCVACYGLVFDNNDKLYQRMLIKRHPMFTVKSYNKARVKHNIKMIFLVIIASPVIVFTMVRNLFRWFMHRANAR
jgi:hypothetical protein